MNDDELTVATSGVYTGSNTVSMDALENYRLATTIPVSSWGWTAESNLRPFQEEVASLKRKLSLQDIIIEANTDEIQVLKKRLADLEKGE